MNRRAIGFVSDGGNLINIFGSVKKYKNKKHFFKMCRKYYSYVFGISPISLEEIKVGYVKERKKKIIKISEKYMLFSEKVYYIDLLELSKKEESYQQAIKDCIK